MHRRRVEHSVPFETAVHKVTASHAGHRSSTYLICFLGAHDGVGEEADAQEGEPRGGVCPHGTASLHHDTAPGAVGEGDVRHGGHAVDEAQGRSARWLLAGDGRIRPFEGEVLVAHKKRGDDERLAAKTRMREEKRIREEKRTNLGRGQKLQHRVGWDYREGMLQRTRSRLIQAVGELEGDLGVL